MRPTIEAAAVETVLFGFVFREEQLDPGLGRDALEPRERLADRARLPVRDDRGRAHGLSLSRRRSSLRAHWAGLGLRGGRGGGRTPGSPLGRAAPSLRCR